MQRNIGKCRFPVRSIALVLAIAVAWTLPFVATISTTTMARYTAGAGATRSAHVARWDVVYGLQPSAVRHQNITVYHTSTTATHANPAAVTAATAWRSGVTSRTFTIVNNSQVTADVENIVLRYVINDTTSPTAASPTVAGSTHTHGAHNIVFNASPNVQALAGNVFRHRPGATGTRTIQIRATDRAQPNFAIRWYRVFFHATQVD
ncbi:MAG: hypothetical protein FWD06_01705 [Oscillospiraceae bacterium]|nr:hypothetical protein [Oscillospiraceae bacterium]